MHILCILISYSTTYRWIDSFNSLPGFYESCQPPPVDGCPAPTSTSGQDAFARRATGTLAGATGRCHRWSFVGIYILRLTKTSFSVADGKQMYILDLPTPGFQCLYNKGLVWDFLFKMSCHPGGDWNPGWRVDPMYSTISGLLKQILAGDAAVCCWEAALWNSNPVFYKTQRDKSHDLCSL